ncbi:unnamed protein product, partial [Effrenium voratum]
MGAVKDFMQTVNFCRHVLGMSGGDALTTPWISGIVRGAQFVCKERKQSRVLTVQEVLTLECILIDGRFSLTDRYGAGCILFLLYSRARVSDVRNVSSHFADIVEGSARAGFIEEVGFKAGGDMCRVFSGGFHSAWHQSYAFIMACEIWKIFLPDATRSGMISLDKDAGAERLSSNSLPPDQASERHDELEGLTDEQEPQAVFQEKCREFKLPADSMQVLQKVTKEITIDAHQRLQVKDGKSKVTCETHSELLLTQALLRRALALDLTGGVRRLDDGSLPLDAQFPSLQTDPPLQMQP